MDRLVVLLYGSVVGVVSKADSGKLIFTYNERWRNAGPGIPLSSSMPLTTAIYPDKYISTFLWGLMSDNPNIINQISKLGDPCSPRNVFNLIAKVGEDCAGAIQVVPEGRVQILKTDNHVDYLSESEVGESLRALKIDEANGAPQTAWRNGKFSLAGAQPKLALTENRKTGQFGVATGTVPTTHIFKPPMAGLDGQVENEHFCLSLAAALGLPTAKSQVRVFAGETAIVVTRYDRIIDAKGVIQRIHQEDMCQALSVHPTLKYQSEGGPSAVKIMNDVLTNSKRADLDRQTFSRALILNFLIGGTDAHAKNYSLVYGKGGESRLAPLYDINSILPYKGFEKPKMAMSIGGKYEISSVYPRHWEKFAADCKLDPEMVIQDLRDMTASMPDLCLTVAAACRKDGLNHWIIGSLVDEISNHCQKVEAGFVSAVKDNMMPY